MKNKDGFKPVQLIRNDNAELKELLQSAEYGATLEEEEAKNCEYCLVHDINGGLTLQDIEDEEPSDAGEASASDDE